MSAAEVPTQNLPDYGGKKVLRTLISVRKAGDGLSEGLAIDPQVYPIGSRVQVVLDCVVRDHSHGPLRGKDADYLELEQVLMAETGVVVAPALVAEVLDKHRRKLELATEAKAGVGHLDVAGYGEDLQKAHEDGLHAAGLVPGCPDCDHEADQAKAEAEVTPLTGRKRKST